MIVVYWMLCAGWGIASSAMGHVWNSKENLIGLFFIMAAYIVGKESRRV